MLFSNSIFSYNITGGAITGPGSLTMSGSGTTTIFNANTYSGGTFVTAGTLVFASGGSVASTSGTSTFNVSGGATLTFQAGSELVTGSIGLADNGTVNLNNPAVTLSALTGTGVLNLNTTALSISSGGYTGTINGTGSVIINTSMNFGGIGIFNTYSGGTTINGSSGTQVVVTVGSNGAFGTGPVVFSNAALQTHHHHRVAADDHGRQSNRQQLLVRVGRHRPLPRRRPDRPGRQRHPSGRGSPPSALPAPPTVLGGTLSDGPAGPSTLVKVGAGTLVLAGNNSTYSGGSNVSVGTLVLAGNNPFGGTTIVASGATVQLNTSTGLGTSTTSSVNIASGGTMVVVDNSGLGRPRRVHPGPDHHLRQRHHHRRHLRGPPRSRRAVGRLRPATSSSHPAGRRSPAVPTTAR